MCCVVCVCVCACACVCVLVLSAHYLCAYTQETMEDMDKNKDGYVTVEEYISKLNVHY